MTVGQKIKDLRIKKNLSQEDVAKSIGSTKQAIYKYETGIVTNIPIDKISMLADLFGVSPAYLMGWDSKAEKTNDAIADIVVRMRTDNEFFDVIELISNLDNDKLKLIKQMLLTFK